MEDVIYYYCMRPGCNKLVGAQRINNSKVVEEEFYPGVQKDENGKYYCEDCFECRDEFLVPEVAQ